MISLIVGRAHVLVRNTMTLNKKKIGLRKLQGNPKGIKKTKSTWRHGSVHPHPVSTADERSHDASIPNALQRGFVSSPARGMAGSASSR